MTEAGSLRRRIKEDKHNDKLQEREDGKKHVDFIERESTLTVLLRTSPHIRAIYHIFIAILILLFLDTFIYDFVEKGEIKLGVTSVVHGFGDVRRCGRLWLLELALALLFHPAMQVYAAGDRLLQGRPAARRAWAGAGAALLAALQAVLLALPVWDLAREHLALASGVVITLEMIRFFMKIHSVAMVCAERCRQSQHAHMPTLQQYIYFLFAPTLLYRDSYPRTKKIRWGVVAYHVAEVAAIIFYNSFLWERFILPYWSDYGKEETVEVGRVVRGMFACILPGMISFLSGFYCLLHAWLNAAAELLTFADRLFYEDWWTMSQFSRYYRAWNRVVHVWLRDHIYAPLAPRAGRLLAYFTVFFVSALAHELVLTLSFGFFYPVLWLEFGVFGLASVPATAGLGRRFPNALNLLMWLGFLIGNGILWSLYPMEYFARKNCPPSPGDHFLVPKSWSCPRIVMKTNWTFHHHFQY